MILVSFKREKTIINRLLSKKGIVLVVHVTLLKPKSNSETVKHLRSNINHYFTWAVISSAPKNAKTRKKLEASYIALWKPDLNEQKDFESFI